MADLVAASDPDIAKFAAGDQELFLKTAGDAVRRYCGWHIFPATTMIDELYNIGSGGLIMLRSRFVTAVAAVKIGDTVLTAEVDYRWSQEGWIELPGWYRGQVAVSYTHGYSELPVDLKLVVLEVMSNAQELPSGTATSFSTPGFGLTVSTMGNTLTDDHKERLTPYKLGGVS
jgi:hypothetical protein